MKLQTLNYINKGGFRLWSKLLALVPHGARDKKRKFPQVVGKVFQYVLVEDPKEEKGQMLLKLKPISLTEFYSVVWLNTKEIGVLRNQENCLKSAAMILQIKQQFVLELSDEILYILAAQGAANLQATKD